jgi:hypothetical protein
MAVFGSKSFVNQSTSITVDFIADKTYCLTETGQVVEEGDPQARFLLVSKGGRLPHHTAMKYDMFSRVAKNAEDDAAEEKQIAKAPANKAITNKETK